MPIPLLAIYGAVAGVSALAKGGYGLYQRRQGMKRARNNNIDNQVLSAETKKNLGLAERMAREGLPEASYQAQKDAIDRGTAFGVKQLQTGRNIASGVADIVANQNRGMNILNAQDAEAKQRNQGLLMRYRDVVAGEKRRGYEEEAAAAQALIGAGTQNIMGGIDSLTSGALNAAMLGGEGGAGAIGGAKKKRLSGLMKFSGAGGSPGEEVDLSMLG